MQLSPFPCHLVPLRSKYFPQHPILKHPQPAFLPQCQRPGFTPIQNHGQNYSSIYLFSHRLQTALFLLSKYFRFYYCVIIFSVFWGGSYLLLWDTLLEQKGKLKHFLLLPPLVLQPAVGFGLSNNTSPFFPTYHQHSPSSHSQHLKIFFYFFSPSFPGSSSSSHPFQFLSEDLIGHPVFHSLQVTHPTYPLPLHPFYYILSFT